eukprot:gene8299-11230_t
MTEGPIYNKYDFSSFSNYDEAISTHIHLDWSLDFDNQRLGGFVEHIIKVIKPNTTVVSFDTSKSINIIGDVKIDGIVVSFELSDLDAVLGRKLSISIPQELQYENATFTIKIDYFISSDASAIQWLPASATKGKKLPYVFTQSQAIHARSLFPCMDSPGVKTPYTARVIAPEWSTVLMSALRDSPSSTVPLTNPIPNPPSTSSFDFTQPIPMPAYLIALAAGNLASRDISGRVRIWSEPEVVDAAFFEFSETESFLSAAEDLTCPYPWTRYDVLCLPPSFPYGGMENPCLTFATPTLLAGDKSLADVIAHEIAHSWTGNLITNHTWDHFWLNEGWTVWLERKIVSAVKGREHGKLSSQIGWKHLKDDIARMGEDDPFTQLVWPLSGQDPDDAFSSAPYEKGFLFLSYLESLVGESWFLVFVKAYIERFQYSTITSGEFKDFFISFFEEFLSGSKKNNDQVTPGKSENGSGSSTSGASSKKKKKKSTSNSTHYHSTPPKHNSKSSHSGSAHKLEVPTVPVTPENAAATLAAINEINWEGFFLTPGVPKSDLDFTNSLSTDATNLASKWIVSSKTLVLPPTGTTGKEMTNWSSQQKCIFLESLLTYVEEEEEENSTFSSAFLATLDTVYAFTVVQNAEIKSRWQSLCLLCDEPKIVPAVVEFIKSQGRMKFVRPLYRQLRATSFGKQIAIDTFEANKDIYHPIARKMIATDLAKAAEADLSSPPVITQQLKSPEKSNESTSKPSATPQSVKKEESKQTTNGGSISSKQSEEHVTEVISHQTVVPRSLKSSSSTMAKTFIEQTGGNDRQTGSIQFSEEVNSPQMKLIPPPVTVPVTSNGSNNNVNPTTETPVTIPSPVRRLASFHHDEDPHSRSEDSIHFDIDQMVSASEDNDAKRDVTSKTTPSNAEQKQRSTPNKGSTKSSKGLVFAGFAVSVALIVLFEKFKK